MPPFLKMVVPNLEDDNPHTKIMVVRKPTSKKWWLDFQGHVVDGETQNGPIISTHFRKGAPWKIIENRHLEEKPPYPTEPTSIWVNLMISHQPKCGTLNVGPF